MKTKDARIVYRVLVKQCHPNRESKYRSVQPDIPAPATTARAILDEIEDNDLDQEMDQSLNLRGINRILNNHLLPDRIIKIDAGPSNVWLPREIEWSIPIQDELITDETKAITKNQRQNIPGNSAEMIDERERQLQRVLTRIQMDPGVSTSELQNMVPSDSEYSSKQDWWSSLIQPLLNEIESVEEKGHRWEWIS